MCASFNTPSAWGRARRNTSARGQSSTHNRGAPGRGYFARAPGVRCVQEM